MKISPLDKLFSEYIRKRAMTRVHGCERCLQGKISYKQLHCAHMFPRRRRIVRFDEDNACGLCPGCHRYLDDNALDKVRFFSVLLGEEKFDLLESRANQIGKVDENLITLYLQQKIKEVESY
jgi:hypothetical protein